MVWRFTKKNQMTKKTTHLGLLPNCNSATKEHRRFEALQASNRQGNVQYNKNIYNTDEAINIRLYFFIIWGKKSEITTHQSCWSFQSLAQNPEARIWLVLFSFCVIHFCLVRPILISVQFWFVPICWSVSTKMIKYCKPLCYLSVNIFFKQSF